MLTFYKNDGKAMVELDAPCEGCWINLSDPTPEELSRVEEVTGVLPDYLQAALDEEERSRIESDEDQTLVIVDIPRVEADGEGYMYSTLPMAIIHLPEYVITVCLYDSPLVRDMTDGRVKSVETNKKTRFILQLLYRNASRFLWYLRQIDHASNRIHAELQRSYRNKELLEMMSLEKSLVYFSTSLMSNEAVLERLAKVSYIRKYPEDEDLLEDVIIENKQGIEMCSVFRDILSSATDAYASIISNNLNMVMKVMTAVTILIAVPTFVTGAFGMNVGGIPFAQHPWGFWVVSGICVACAAVLAVVMGRRKMF